MGTALQNLFDADVAATEADMPGGFYFPQESNKLTVAQINAVEGSVLGGEFGYLQQYDFYMVVRASLFPKGVVAPGEEDPLDVIHPVTGERVVCNVKSKSVSPDGVSYTYGLKAQS